MPSTPAGVAADASAPAIRSERLSLRAFGPEHEQALFELWNDPDVGRYLWDGAAVARETILEQIAISKRSFATRGYGQFALFLLEAPDELIGFAGLRAFGEPEQVELLYALRPAQWRRGLASEAARAVLRFGFEQARLDEIVAGADPANAASFRVIERLGVTFDRELAVAGRPARYYRIGRNPGR